MLVESRRPLRAGEDANDIVIETCILTIATGNCVDITDTLPRNTPIYWLDDTTIFTLLSVWLSPKSKTWNGSLCHSLRIGYSEISSSCQENGYLLERFALPKMTSNISLNLTWIHWN